MDSPPSGIDSGSQAGRPCPRSSEASNRSWSHRSPSRRASPVRQRTPRVPGRCRQSVVEKSPLLRGDAAKADELLDVPAKGAANPFGPLLAHEVTHHLQALAGKRITPGTLVHEFQAEYIAHRLLRTLEDADTPDSYKDLRNGNAEDIADWVRSAYADSIKKDDSGRSLPDVYAAARQIDTWVHSYYVNLGSPS
jgi:hypothetical protein